ncbi:hypothetical protein [Thermodesulfatator autotrophicus]|uniref:GAK system XXXCH domain-containing protein n=1 Tax=Thermodesulfatator autotrophicus TaxID=1795632 RepID=A0A177E7X4_9BACT|nr:hypothetical protein [Thermodesulfatator autotrophicus]OAG28047.1 hypothetical protein TH606_03730 [Thermodesulfatator autotrophicus]
MAKIKEQQKISPLELADFLENFAQKIREGKLSFKDEDWPLPETLGFKWELKIDKKGLKLKFTLSAERSLSFEKKISSPKGSWEPDLSPKSLKKKMGAIWKSIEKDIFSGRKIPSDDFEELLGLFRAYEKYAEKSWLNAWQKCREKIESLRQVIENNDPEKARQMVSEIKNLEKACHRKYK